MLGIGLGVVLVLILTTSVRSLPLNQGLYGDDAAAAACLQATWAAAQANVPTKSRGQCLRLAFHDSATFSIDPVRFQQGDSTGGANGSIDNTLERQDVANSGLFGADSCLNFVQKIIIPTANPSCNNQLTLADAIQVTAAAVVALSNGPKCNMLMGRQDKIDPQTKLPLPDIVTLLGMCNNRADDLATQFASNGFADPLKALTVLSGAHHIGGIRAPHGCSPFVGKQPKPIRNAVSQSPADFPGPQQFDGSYYDLVIVKQAPFDSDNCLADNPTTLALAKTYSTNGATFDADWCEAFQKLSLLGVQLPPGKSFTDGFDPDPNGNAGPQPTASPPPPVINAPPIPITPFPPPRVVTFPPPPRNNGGGGIRYSSPPPPKAIRYASPPPPKAAPRRPPPYSNFGPIGGKKKPAKKPARKPFKVPKKPVKKAPVRNNNFGGIFVP